ncbi:protein LLP homolog isoform X2 [Xenia sp. Carnegie-2017]|uniref:protein LLP homolog isoform X2 n=1 Tax=Xenia sp. Carnegie-2017 TaxID=2897299 RepID=UPI001F03BDDA|nr:protein LLP homolog isoform X2 [Xenia sp. Carnegie-2017]
MAKSIRSKSKRKLRAAKREKIVAKDRLKLLAIQEQQEGIKMMEDSSEKKNIQDRYECNSEGIESMDTGNETQQNTMVLKKKLKKTSRSKSGKSIKRLNRKKKKNKYKW